MQRQPSSSLKIFIYCHTLFWVMLFFTSFICRLHSVSLTSSHIFYSQARKMIKFPIVVDCSIYPRIHYLGWLAGQCCYDIAAYFHEIWGSKTYCATSVFSNQRKGFLTTLVIHAVCEVRLRQDIAWVSSNIDENWGWLNWTDSDPVHADYQVTENPDAQRYFNTKGSQSMLKPTWHHCIKVELKSITKTIFW